MVWLIELAATLQPRRDRGDEVPATGQQEGHQNIAKGALEQGAVPTLLFALVISLELSRVLRCPHSRQRTACQGLRPQ